MQQLISADIHHIWLPKGDPKAVVICVHGLGLHGGCYHHLGTTLSYNGFAVLAIDIRGLGCWRSQVYVRDLIAVRNLLNDNERSARMLLRTPILVLQGYGDRLFVPRDTLSLFERLATPEKELVYIGNAEHLMLQSRRQDHRGLSVLMGWMQIIVTKLCKRDPSNLPAPFCELRLVNHFAHANASLVERDGDRDQRAA